MNSLDCPVKLIPHNEEPETEKLEIFRRAGFIAPKFPDKKNMFFSSSFFRQVKTA